MAKTELIQCACGCGTNLNKFDSRGRERRFKHGHQQAGRQVLWLIGQRFGRLVVVKRVANNKRGQARWLCKCDCGQSCERNSYNLRAGVTKSCGCLRKEMGATLGRSTRTHGHASSRSLTYNTWTKMKDRCNNPKHTKWRLYGGRGITVCDRWMNSFEDFLADMGERPPGMSIDRYPDKDGNYEPGNCRWATLEQQNQNRRKFKRKRNQDDEWIRENS